MNGTIKWYDIQKGYGFVTTDDGDDIFIHASGIKSGRKYTGFNKGDVVNFETGTRDGKAIALDVSLDKSKK